jgi:hypothetical protein
MKTLGILVAYPWLAWVVAGCFAFLWWWSDSRVAAAAAVVWTGYGSYEYLMLTRVLCTGECNIRVDLLLIYPLLLLVSLIAVLSSIRARGAKRRKA